ncbi:Signal transduction histidine kinase [Acetitomaculum ruminis DSM 5522]|uniref:histidine kinase n=1 Tax=Acetitomaculum ruminis DSM 5522 TaxID=1120918 RepID=A0A1I0YHK9_9FIRM|nr:HAMP domain-containing sensor histidine kinase [Acetitomaculum ruminis]SFB12859.1 Signal transduction histidine kinase [Acetitomaculum ruminis DSM 5522]
MTNKSGDKKMRSIVGRLHRHWAFKRFFMYLFTDILFFFIILGLWLANQELMKNKGGFDNLKRGVVLVEKSVKEYDNPLESIDVKSFKKTDNSKEFSISNLVYYVKDFKGKIIYATYLYYPVFFLASVVLGIFIIQLILALLGFNKEGKKIRNILKPINEMALKIDEISKLTFSDEKYQKIEEAIANIKPTDSDEISFHDEDLEGIEAAMNNLLIRMRDSYKQQARFVNDASHELRTPIAVIEGYVNMLDRWGKEDESVLDESINAIKHESKHMKTLVEQLLFLARGDSGRNRLNFEEMSLNNLMEEIYEESVLIDEEHIYHYFKPKEEYTIKADPTMLKQAVRILTDNAAKYTNKGDEIIFALGNDEENNTYIMVQDSGIGMAENDVEHMFERFFRSDEARNYSGTGLGLSIAKWIIDKHKGHFEILSREGLGTRIKIVF